MLTRPALWSTRSLRSRTSSSLPSIRHVSTYERVIHIHRASFYHHHHEAAASASAKPLFPNLKFSLHAHETSRYPRQHWAVIGTQEKEPFFNVIRGQYICDPPDARRYPYLRSKDVGANDPRNAIQYVGFSKEGSAAIGGTRGAYLSARYESYREETDWTLGQFLKGQTSLNPLEGGKEGKELHDDGLLAQVVGDLRLNPLLDMPVANLSNGQMRRARIAKALLSQSELLLLDEPFMGLDPATAHGISKLLHRVAVKAQPRLMLGLRPQDTIPDWINHLMILQPVNQTFLSGPRDRVTEELWKWKERLSRGTLTGKGLKKEASHDTLRQLLHDLSTTEPISTPLPIPSRPGGDALIEMDGVNVRYQPGSAPVLGDWKQKLGATEATGLHWTVRRGQRWAILGANGSGKTTLLSLITSDHPQAYALPVRLFGQSRLPEPGKPAISLFELQSRVGHSSPEIHAVFPRQLTVRQALESAFADAFLSKPKLDHDRDEAINAALRFFKADLDATAQEAGIAHHEFRDLFPPVKNTAEDRKSRFLPPGHDIEFADHLSFAGLSTAQQRLVLFLRAVVHKPDIILLDEAFSGMSGVLRDKCIHFLEAGEKPPSEGISIPRRTSAVDGTVGGLKPADSEIRHHGLSDNQALIVVSHVKEEIPDCVRHVLRLPWVPGDDVEPREFACAALRTSSALSDPHVWDAAWSPSLRRGGPSAENDVVATRKYQAEKGSATHPEDHKYDWTLL